MKIMKTLKFITLLIVLTGIAFTSCKKDPSSTSLEVKINAINNSFPILKATSATTPSLVWDTCFMNVSKINLEAEIKENETSTVATKIDYNWKGLKKIDLFSVNSIIGNIILTPGLYDKISLKISAYKADVGTSPVFYLSGNYKNANGINIPIIVIVNENLEFKIAKDDTKLNAIYNYSSMLKLNLTLLMSNILQSELDGALLSNGKIVISTSSNSSLLVKIKGNFLSSGDSEFKQK